MQKELIEKIQIAFKYLGEQVGKQLQITDKFSQIKGNYDRHFTTTNIVKFKLKHFGVRTSGAIAMINGEDGQTYEFRVGSIKEIIKSEDKVIIQLAIGEKIHRRIEIKVE